MTERIHPLLSLVAALVLAGCGGAPGTDVPDEPPAPAPAEDGVEAVSLLGDPLRRPALDPAFAERQQRLLAEARTRLEANPDDVDALIWVARRTAYLGRFREAIGVLDRGIREHPDEARLYRHRGHRYITLRRFEDAVADLEHAAALIEDAADSVEPDGLPNPRGVPRTTTHFNVWYHLGLARYMTTAYPAAEQAMRRALEVARNDDSRVAASYWLYLALRRQGRDSRAGAVLRPIHEGLDIVENHDYQRLLLMFLDRREPDEVLAEVDPDDERGFVTTAYGAANAHLYAGRAHRATGLLREIVGTDAWDAFGYIAAEADLARMQREDY